MARLYSVKAGTRRWPVAVLYNILDLACINAFVFYKMRTNEKISRRDFIFKLATELRQVYMNSKKPCGPQAHHLPKVPLPGINTAPKRKKCQITAKCLQNKTAKYWHSCSKMVCGNA